MVTSDNSSNSNSSLCFLEDRRQDTGFRAEDGSCDGGNRITRCGKIAEPTEARCRDGRKDAMVRKRTEFKPVLVGQKGQEKKVDYMRALEIARACDNLPPLIEDKEI